MLKTKMFLSFSIVSLFIVAITCGMFYVKYANDIQDQTSSLSSVISRQFSEMVDLYMQNIEELSLAVSISPAVQNGLLDYRRASNSLEKEIIGYKLSPFLFDFSYPKPYVQGISIHTPDAYMYDYTKLVEEKPAVPYTASELLKFNQALESKKFILRPSLSKEGAEAPASRVVSFIRRINRIPTQQTIGFVNININVNAFKALETANDPANELKNSMSMLLVDDQGVIIYENKNRLNDSALQTFDVNLLQPGHSEGELQWKNKRYFYSYESSDYTSWRTVVLIPKDVVLLKQKRIQEIVLTVGVLTMSLIAFVSYILSHQITVPLRKIMVKMSSVELGNFNERMDYKGKNELGKLSRMYNLMLDSISRLIHEVYESKLAEKNAQLSALHAQINPHFLYNTLNIMKSISRLRGIEEVAEISESLASLFQYSMKNLHHPVTLERELEHIRHYFNIQQHRFGSRMRLDVEIPEYLLGAQVLKLTIQPLIENAVDHGIRRMKAGGCIRVEATASDGTLFISVSDNGAGIEPHKRQELQAAFHSTSALQGLQDAADGIGLLNIHQRLHLFYGGESGLTISCPPEGGTSVRIIMPLRLVKQEEAVGIS
ncbi:sensor histidine kinase [Paenibacillus sp. GCM10023248]|uniref:cache domain-containing sensor histidine kinase n=1 Tax=Bacillales TaxID=1385 RepID=UPI0023791BA8|nr:MULTISPECIES: sensor histidine kinase [Bacillales]MDD9268376.1 sensor histidine kinase [Paenibacillus sp. MAHUQ-63]MDR6879266.1 sensor histidine kinase YesM [Bacillus sp. 3255]